MKLSERIRNQKSDFYAVLGEWADGVALLEDENERLREAIKDIAGDIYSLKRSFHRMVEKAAWQI